ncbi:hypothetical protein [Sediminicoccus sp. KRV36]|uniref:hypothetical protein n=1 Tax=Sediminicoccus sp. KRV36 TaxID=3133721 RepID=UPI00200E58AA|nr:hypothetical protein [Sediminicoccus rosea]UPY38406.1 hypothetical protein LHU95_06850 [Sediminicoccus rosea]
MKRWIPALLLLAACEQPNEYAYDPIGPRQVLTGEQAQAVCERRGLEAQAAWNAAPAGNRLPGYNAVYDPCMAEMGWRRRLLRSYRPH